jgi:RNA polymerase sigma-70 factor (ECF subfamily)
MNAQAPTVDSSPKRKKAARKAPAVPHREAERKATRGPRARKNQSEFEAQVLPHQEELYATALRYTRDSDAAQDLVQETMMRALAAWSRFVPGSNARAWLFRILTNSFINHYRRRKRHRRFTHETGDDATFALYGYDVERSANPHQQIFRETLGDEVQRALDSLAEDYRRVVELADLRGIRYRDIAAELEVPIGTVMSRLFRARRQVEDQLREFAESDYGICRRAA